jgi:hypothetical protein
LKSDYSVIDTKYPRSIQYEYLSIKAGELNWPGPENARAPGTNKAQLQSIAQQQSFVVATTLGTILNSALELNAQVSMLSSVRPNVYYPSVFSMNANLQPYLVLFLLLVSLIKVKFVGHG